MEHMNVILFNPRQVLWNQCMLALYPFFFLSRVHEFSGSPEEVRLVGFLSILAGWASVG